MTGNKPRPPQRISRREFLTLAAAGAVGALAGCCPAPQTAVDIALAGGTLIDGTGAAPLPDAVVTIREGHIAAVGISARVEVPKTAQVIDVRGATILPGFINAHVHGSYDETTLKAWAQGGVTTVRDMATGQAPKDAFAFRDGVRDNLHCARLVAAGPMVTVPGGYPIARWGVDSITVTSPEDARQKVDQLLDDGADFVKIPLESGAIFGFSMPMLSPEETAAIVETAHTRGARVSTHVSVTQDLEKALDAGVDDIAHMVTDELPDELIARMVESGTYWVPTIELWKGVGYGLGRHVVDNLRRFVEAGGKVALGTDYAGAPNVDFDLGMPFHEIEWMLEAGMTPLQIIVAATQHAAHVCNLEQEIGTLEVGEAADILVVDGDPLEDIHALTETMLVFREGVSA
ncbi:MAG: amidohydrolase family protein [Anaerolineae bacterium]|nr:amidohydrolase family protein [Anaerolineae bacterium]